MSVTILTLKGEYERTFLVEYNHILSFPGGASGKEPACRCRRHRSRRFNPWVGKIPWRRAWQAIPGFSPGESHGWRCLAGYRPQGLRVGHDGSDSACTHVFSLESGRCIVWKTFETFIHSNKWQINKNECLPHASCCWDTLEHWRGISVLDMPCPRSVLLGAQKQCTVTREGARWRRL